MSRTPGKPHPSPALRDSLSMPSMTTASLSLPPSWNRTYRAASHMPRNGHGSGTHVYKTAAAKLWIDEAIPTLRTAGIRNINPDAEVHVRLDVFCADARDIDSVVKITLDSIAEAGGFDDKRVMGLHVLKHPTKSRAHHRMTVNVALDSEATNGFHEATRAGL